MIGSLKNLVRYHEITLHVVVTLSFFAVFGDGVGAPMRIGFVVAAVGAWLVRRQQWHLLIPDTVWNVLIFVSIGVTAFRMYFTEESIISSGIMFILLLMLLKLWSRKGVRDDWQVYALSFLLMAAATAVNEDLVYGLLFAAYVITTTFGLALFHLKSETDMYVRSGPTNPLTNIYVTALIVLSSAVLLSSLVLFFTFPRIGLGFFATKERTATSMTGFSTEVELGSHGAIRNNPAVVMRVEFDGDTPPVGFEGFHWRVIGFDEYDGTRWLRTRSHDLASLGVNRGERSFVLDNMYAKGLRSSLERDTKLPSLRVYLEPLGTDQIPVLWPTAEVKPAAVLSVPFSPKAGVIQYDQTFGDVLFRSRNEIGISYDITLYREPKTREIDGEPFDRADRRLPRKHLQLPPGMERVRELAREVTRDASSAYEMAKAVETHLSTQYTYTLDLPEVNRDNPVDSFLFEARRGHCEYFATSMALMVRSVGVPARVVNGFLGGTYNEVGGYIAVRQGDAHSWVEVYLPEYGWVPFDPTPAAEADFRLGDEQGPLKFLRNSYDTLRMNWMKYVIEYDLDTQLEGLRAVGNMLSPNSKFLGGSEDSAEDDGEQDKVELPVREVLLYGVFAVLCLIAFQLGRWRRERKLLPAAAPVVILAALGAGWVGWFFSFAAPQLVMGGLGPLFSGLLGRMFGRAFGPRSSRDRVQRLFISLEQEAARYGHQRREDEGPDQFLGRMAESFEGARSLLERFRNAYLRARFGGAELTPQEVDSLRTLLSEVRKAMRERS